MIDAVVYSSGAVTVHPCESDADLRAAKRLEGTTWVRAVAVSEADLTRVAEVFGVHPLVVDDVTNNVRPKVEEFADYTFVLVKDAELMRGDLTFEGEVRRDAVGVVIGNDWVLTLSTAPVPEVDRIWDRIVSEDERILQRGPDFTAYLVIDVLVDEYFDILDAIETQIEAIEEEVLVSTDIATLEAINEVRRDLLAFRKLAWPTREALGSLARGDSDFVMPETEKYYRDVYDQIVSFVDLIETYRDLARGAREIYLNTLSQSTNEVMKTLTIIATVFLPLTFVVGVYGMNFGDMPELGWPGAYHATMLGMAVLSGMMLLYFRRLDYL